MKVTTYHSPRRRVKMENGILISARILEGIGGEGKLV